MYDLCFVMYQFVMNLLFLLDQVQFGVSFFLIVASGGLSVVATACNLLRRRKPTPDPYPEQREHLLDNFDDLDLQPPSGDPPYPSITTEAPPPYAP